MTPSHGLCLGSYSSSRNRRSLSLGPGPGPGGGGVSLSVRHLPTAQQRVGNQTT